MSSEVPETVVDDFSKDVQQLAELATIFSATKDALNDDMITRLSSAFSEGITLLDRLTRNDGLMQLLMVLDRPEVQHLLMSFSTALSEMSREVATSPPAKGGVISLMKLASEPGVQEGLRSMALLGEHWSESLRELHHKGG